MTAGKNDDAASSREDAFLSGLIPQVTEKLAEQHARGFDAEAGQARFETWLTAHTREPAAPAKGRASDGYAKPRRIRRVKRSLARLPAARPAVPIPASGSLRYSDRDRKLDYRKGRADARRHLPLVPRQPAPDGAAELVAAPGTDGKPTIEPTPFLTELYYLRNQALAELFATYLSKRNQLLDQLRDADGRHGHLLSELDTAQSQLEAASTPLTEEEATRRHLGELAAGHPEELVRRRRARDRQREVAAARAQLDDITRRLHEAGVAAGRARNALADQLKATQARGLAINSYFEHRKASYLNGLAHRHHRSPEMLRALALTDPGLPEWLTWSQHGLTRA